MYSTKQKLFRKERKLTKLHTEAKSLIRRTWAACESVLTSGELRKMKRFKKTGSI
jgi:hypothetical protein